MDLESDNVRVFHTEHLTVDELSTSVVVNNKETMGEIECMEISDGYIITIRKVY